MCVASPKVAKASTVITGNIGAKQTMIEINCNNCICLGNLGLCNTKRSNPIYVTLLKVAKASTVNMVNVPHKLSTITILIVSSVL
jgi:hypothetical protein